MKNDFNNAAFTERYQTLLETIRSLSQSDITMEELREEIRLRTQSDSLQIQIDCMERIADELAEQREDQAGGAPGLILTPIR